MPSYPKLVASDTIRGTQGGMNVSSSASVPATHTFQNNTSIQVAPNRYSNVRSVVFSFTTGKLGNGTTSTCQLLVLVASTTTPALTAQEFNLPFSTVVEGASDYGFTPTNRIDAGINGSTTTIVQAAVTAQERDQAQILQVTFDREDAAAATFFTAWDSFDDDDDYMLIQPAVDSLTADTGSTIAYRFKSFQCAVIQEDDFQNDTSTDWHSYIGCRDELEATVAFQGVLFGPRMPFHYVAADWNGLDSVSVIFYGNETATSTQLTVRVFDVTDASLVFDENFALPAAGVSYYVARTQDFLSSLIDGNDYYVDYLLDAADNLTDPRGTGYFCLIQKDFTRSATFHQITNLAFTPTVVDTCDGGAILFDPAWYDGTSPRERIFVSAFAHNEATNNPRQSLRLDTNLLSDDSARGSGTASDMTPEHTFTGTPIVPQFSFTDILTNDPLDEAGQVRLQKSYLDTSVWTAGVGDFPGQIGVYYAYTMPRSAQALSQFGSGDPAFDTDIGPI